MASNVTIPVYNQQTETPYGGGPRPLPEAIVKPVDTGTGVGQLGDTMMKIWQVQAKNQADLNVATQLTDFQVKSTALKVAAAGMPGSQMGDFYKTKSDELIKEALSHPENQPIQQELSIGLARAQATGLDELQVAAMTATAKDQDAQTKGLATTTAALSAANYKAIPNPDGTVKFQDTPDGMDAEHRYLNVVNALHPAAADPGQNQAKTLDYLHDKALMRGQLIGRDQPALLDAYLKSPEAKILTPTEGKQLEDDSIAHKTDAYRNSTADLEAQKDKTENEIRAAMASGGDWHSMLVDAERHNEVRPGFYQSLIGQPFRQRMTSDPGVAASYEARANAVNTVAEAKNLINEMNLASRPDSSGYAPLVGGDASRYAGIAMRNATMHDAKQAEAKKAAWDSISNTYLPVAKSGMINPTTMFGAHIEPRALSTHFQTTWDRYKGDRAKVDEEMKRFVDKATSSGKVNLNTKASVDKLNAIRLKNANPGAP